MKYTIEIGEYCFGRISRVNNKDIIEYGYDDSKLNLDLVNFVFKQINLVKDKLDKSEIYTLVSILWSRSKNRSFDLTDEEYDNLDDDEDSIQIICDKLNNDCSLILSELELAKEELDSYDWYNLLEIIISNSNSILIEAKNDDCEQCGNYNFNEIYEIEINEKD